MGTMNSAAQNTTNTVTTVTTVELVDFDTAMVVMEIIAALSDFAKAKLVTIAQNIEDTDYSLTTRFSGNRGENSCVRSLIEKGALSEPGLGGDVVLTDVGRHVVKAVWAEGNAHADELADLKEERRRGF